eukprot:6173435-Pleurochrysis_carterae.AAC.2
MRQWNRTLTICAHYCWETTVSTASSTRTRRDTSSEIHASDGVSRRLARRSLTPGWIHHFHRHLAASGIMHRRYSNLRLDATSLAVRPSRLKACSESLKENDTGRTIQNELTDGNATGVTSASSDLRSSRRR